MDAAEYALMDAVEDSMWWYRALRARVRQALAERPGPALPLLDAGCGTGGMIAALPAGRAVVGFDFVPQAAGRARAKTGRPLAVADITRQPFPDLHFGAALSLDVLGHRSLDPALALAELHRVLAPGGTLILNLPAFEWLKSAHDSRVHNARRFTCPQLRALLAEAGFVRIETRYWNSLLLPLMVIQRKLLARKADAPSDVAPFPPWLDATLFAVTTLEQKLARLGLRYPAGGSVLAIATRP